MTGDTPYLYTVGMFDGVHTGHQRVLARMAEEAQRLGMTPAVLTFANHPAQIVAPERAPGMLCTLDERIKLIRNAGVDNIEVLEFNDEIRHLSAREFLQMLRDRYGAKGLFKGYNNHFGYREAGQQMPDYGILCRELGLMLIDGDELKNDALATKISSTTIRQLLKEGNIDTANTLLGRRYSLEGTVVHGKGLGHTIGFPTANVLPREPLQVVPGCGVYAADAYADGATDQPLRSVVNIGHRPTVDGAQAPITIEAYLIGHDDNLYDKALRIEFLQRMRDEKKFDTLQVLQRQIAQDVSEALKI